MKTTQELYDMILDCIVEEKSKEEVEKRSGNTMHLYHAGSIVAYKRIAKILIRDFKCRSKLKDPLVTERR